MAEVPHFQGYYKGLNYIGHEHPLGRVFIQFSAYFWEGGSMDMAFPLQEMKVKQNLEVKHA